MNNLALTILDGNLVRDPETKKTKNDKTVTTFSVAMNHEYGNKEGGKSVSYVPVEAWDRLAENCATYLKKGSRVTISGNLRQDRWKDNAGKMQSRLKILAREVRFDSSPKEKDENADSADKGAE
ncbi:MAG: single-stranded DNA-binding protein [Spirochaetia bacterium]|nr:single-stranded DNA-binding protein [Spirochaetia bacterium]